MTAENGWLPSSWYPWRTIEMIARCWAPPTLAEKFSQLYLGLNSIRPVYLSLGPTSNIILMYVNRACFLPASSPNLQPEIAINSSAFSSSFISTGPILYILFRMKIHTNAQQPVIIYFQSSWACWPISERAEMSSPKTLCTLDTISV